jgi:hypothetical protein
LKGTKPWKSKKKEVGGREKQTGKKMSRKEKEVAGRLEKEREQGHKNFLLSRLLLSLLSLLMLMMMKMTMVNSENTNHRP